MEDQRNKALQAALSQIERNYGKGAAMILGDKPPERVSATPTGSLGLDIALGVGGLPKGRVIEIYGPESSGKTTLMLHVLAQCQKRGGTAAFIDAEHALDLEYAAKLGINTSDLVLSQPDGGEQALEIADLLVRSGAVDIIVVDSVAALTPKAEIEGEMGASHVGLQARLMSQALRKITGSISRSGCTMIFINQIRMKIGVMFGNPETTTGGNALKFYSSVRLDIRRQATIKEGDVAIGTDVRVKVVKNKVAPPFKEAFFQIIFNEGINHVGEVLDLATNLELVQKSGAWYHHEGNRLGQGRQNAIVFLKENPELLNELEIQVRRHYLPDTVDEFVSGMPKVAKKAAPEPVEPEDSQEESPAKAPPKAATRARKKKAE